MVWLKGFPGAPVKLDDVKSYVDFIDETAHRLTKTIVDTIPVGENPVSIKCTARKLNPQDGYCLDTFFEQELIHEYRVDSVTFTGDLLNQLSNCIIGSMGVRVASDTIEMERNKPIHVYVQSNNKIMDPATTTNQYADFIYETANRLTKTIVANNHCHGMKPVSIGCTTRDWNPQKGYSWLLHTTLPSASSLSPSSPMTREQSNCLTVAMSLAVPSISQQDLITKFEVNSEAFIDNLLKQLSNCMLASNRCVPVYWGEMEWGKPIYVYYKYNYIKIEDPVHNGGIVLLPWVPDVKEYEDFITDTANRLSKTIVATMTHVGETPVSIRCTTELRPNWNHQNSLHCRFLDTFSEQYLNTNYGVDAVRFSGDLLKKLSVYLFACSMYLIDNTSHRPNRSEIGQGTHINVYVTSKVDKVRESININSLRKTSVEQYVARVACKVRLLLKDTVLPAFKRDIESEFPILAGVPPRLKVGKSFICKSDTFNQYDSYTWNLSKGIGNRWSNCYSCYNRGMMVAVAMTDKDLPDCVQRYNTLLPATSNTPEERKVTPESIILKIEGALGISEGGMLVGCKLDNDQNAKHGGKTAGEEKAAFVVYIVYRPDWGRKADELKEENVDLAYDLYILAVENDELEDENTKLKSEKAALEKKINDLERENACLSESNPSEQSLDEPSLIQGLSRLNIEEEEEEEKEEEAS